MHQGLKKYLYKMRAVLKKYKPKMNYIKGNKLTTSAFSSPEMETGTVKGEHSIVFLASLCHAVSENKMAISNSGRSK